LQSPTVNKGARESLLHFSVNLGVLGASVLKETALIVADTSHQSPATSHRFPFFPPLVPVTKVTFLIARRPTILVP